LQRAACTGIIDLYALDQSGFAPTLPTSYTWARTGIRPLIPHEAPEGRRLNVIGALAPFGPEPDLIYHSHTAKLDSAAFLDFVCQKVAGLPKPLAELPEDYTRERPCVIVLDNYAVHKSRLVKEAQPALAQAGVTFFYLPPYSPELNAMELIWRHVKYEGLQVRSHPDMVELASALDLALTNCAARIRQSTTFLCKAA
jgi:hypothetical protein